MKKQVNNWHKFKDTLGLRNKAVLAELQDAPGTVCDLAGRMRVPFPLVTRWMAELLRAGKIRATGATKPNPFGQPPLPVFEATTAKDLLGLAGGQPL